MLALVVHHPPSSSHPHHCLSLTILFALGVTMTTDIRDFFPPGHRSQGLRCHRRPSAAPSHNGGDRGRMCFNKNPSLINP